MGGTTFFGSCKGTTKAGTKCGQVSVYANGYCRHHGGDSTEYDRERFQKVKARAVERSKRCIARLERRYGPLTGK